MAPLPLVFMLFVATPLIEIALFIVVGRRIGLGPTLAIVFATALIGASLVSRQGHSVMADGRAALRRGAFPGRQIADGAMILASGVLLLTPGFLTDAMGFALLVPRVRTLIRGWGSRRFGAGSIPISGYVDYEPSDD